jgi:Holliday junction resolvasome RuvABC endonuclease subunit
VIGIDPSSVKVAAVISSQAKSNFSVVTKKLGRDHTLGAGIAYTFLQDLIRGIDDEVLIYQEAPIMGIGGAQPTIFQAQIGGALMAASANEGVPLKLVNNQSWKKRVCGRGNINKEEVVERMTTVWPELVEYAGKDQDVIDAGAVNLYGWHVLTLRDRVRRGKR